MGLILRLTLRYSRLGFRQLHSECWCVRSAKNGSKQILLNNSTFPRKVRAAFRDMAREGARNVCVGESRKRDQEGRLPWCYLSLVAEPIMCYDSNTLEAGVRCILSIVAPEFRAQWGLPQNRQRAIAQKSVHCHSQAPVIVTDFSSVGRRWSRTDEVWRCFGLSGAERHASICNRDCQPERSRRQSPHRVRYLGFFTRSPRSLPR
jgi:hypothetical protein